MPLFVSANIREGILDLPGGEGRAGSLDSRRNDLSIFPVCVPKKVRIVLQGGILDGRRSREEKI
jgi:hypothetical protein